MKYGASHGLSMVYRKLHTLYKGDFTIIVAPGNPNGLEVMIRIPAGQTDKEEDHGSCSNL